jgi:predicted DCC family thiol-disulfide oxidoreductase YuxK
MTAAEPTSPDASPLPVLLFDGVCNLCNRWVDLLIRLDREGRIRVAPLQSAAASSLLAGAGLADTPGDTVVLIDDAGAWTESTAILRAARLLPYPTRAFAVLAILPVSVRDGLYRIVARNRYRWFGRRDTCRLPGPGERERFL